jgi:hypothetical protein
MRPGQRKTPPMKATQRLFVTLREGVWGVWLGRDLVSTHPTRPEALGMAQTAAREAATRGVVTTLFVGDQDGNHVESVIRPAADPP